MPASDVPLGYCPTCRMAKINQEGVPICPSCSTKSTTRSGLVNMCKDPGDKMDNHGNIHGPIDGAVVKANSIQAGSITTATEIRQVKDVTEPTDIVSESIDTIDKVLCNMRLSDFADLREARKVMKYRKKLANLKLELQDFLG